MRRSACSVVKNASQVEEDMSCALIVVFRDVTIVTKQEASILALKLKEAMKQISTQTKMESRSAISRFWTEPESDPSEALQNVEICCAVMHDCVADVPLSLAGMASLMVGNDMHNAVSELVLVEGGAPKQLSYEGA